jgi:NAD(P)-dependent dehydrogenase (short-subunit alcohol dehydrogenase family)
MTRKKAIVVTGASSGFGRLSANALARSGHTVYASMRETKGRNAPQVADVEKFAKDNRVDLRALELDVNSQESVDAGIAQIVAAHGRLDVIVHNAVTWSSDPRRPSRRNNWRSCMTSTS